MKKIMLFLIILCIFPLTCNAKSINIFSYLKKYLNNIEEYPLESISLNELELNLDIDSIYKLTLNYNPENTTDSKNVIWTSSDENVVKVLNGVIYTAKVGSATISANVNGKIAICVVNVNEYPLENISFEENEGSMFIGDEKTLNIIYNPENTTDDKNIIWKSSDLNIATINDGTIKALNEGTVTITAIVQEKTAIYNLKVIKKITIDDILKNNGFIIKDKYVFGFKENMNINIPEINDINIKTGSKISYNNEERIIVLSGDINGDGIINSIDLLNMKKLLLGKIKLTGAYKEAALLINHKNVNSADLLKLREYLLKKS